MSRLPTATQPEDMAKCREWTSRFLADPTSLPVSFQLGGESIRGVPASWKLSSRARRVDANIVERDLEGASPDGGLSLRADYWEYLDYPVVEWTAWFTNVGSEPTPIIRDIRALDADFTGASPALWHCNGDFYSKDGYTAQETPLQAGDPLRFAPNGGRPSDGAFPYYRLMFAGGGLSLAIGWPGQWSASFAATGDGVHVAAGQEKTHVRLQPGETIRTPRITLMAWSGDASRAANLWRRWYREHVLPRSHGAPLGPRLVAHGTDEGEEFTAATEENQIRYIERWAQQGIPFDTWWIDAGWYPCYDKNHERKWWETGNWTPDPERFPNGLKPVSDCAARHGADLLVWFEPERVKPDTLFDRAAVTLTVEGANDKLLNLGNAACQAWLAEHVCRLIQDNGIKIYRQDHNFEPLRYWRENDAEDRQGMNENLSVQGYLRYWDTLLARNPGLWIDSCASGGRRNDLETMRRSVPLHYSDYGYGEHPVKLAFHHVLFEWLPYFKESTLSWDVDGPSRFGHDEDRFSYHCGFGPMMLPAIDIRRDDYDFGAIREMVAIWRRAADLMLRGDYYPLTPIHRSPEQWVALQFDLPEEGRGFVQAIRLPGAAEDGLTVRPRGLAPEAEYVFENAETGKNVTISGAALSSDGFAIALPKRAGAVWFYRRV